MLAETSLADWTRDDAGGNRSDTVLTGDLLLRYGIDGKSEVQLGWTALGHNRERDSASGAIMRGHGTGDIGLAYKRSLVNPDGAGLSIAVQPFMTLPTGGSAIGAGDWSTGIILPISAEVAHGIALEFSPEVDADVDRDDSGRHAVYGSVAGLDVDLSDAVSTSVALSAFRDDDPAGHGTALLLATALAWQPGNAWQVDLGSAFGLNAHSPDARVYCGIARRF